MKPFIVAWISLLLAAPSFAFDPDFQAIEDLSVPQKYPAGSIVTVTQAQQALDDVRKESEKLDVLLKYSSAHCAENFFVNSCRDDVRKAGVRQKRRLAAIETEADKVLRQAKAQDNKRQLELQEKQKQQSAPEPRNRREVKAIDHEDAAEKTLDYFDKRREDTAKRQQAYEQRKSEEVLKEQEYALKQQQRAQREAQRQEQLQKREEKRAAREAKIREMDEARKNYEQTEAGK